MFDPNTILIPVEVDLDDFEWLPTALDFVRRVEADVHVLFVNDAQAGYRHPAITAKQLEEKIGESLSAEDLEGLSITFAVSRGSVRSEVKKYCQEQRVDMIISGHRHHTKLWSSVFDTTDGEIVDTVDIPVLIIPT